MVKYFLSKDNDELYAFVNGSHVIPHLRLLAANLEQHFSRKIISQVNKCEFFNQTVLMTFEYSASFPIAVLNSKQQEVISTWH